MRHSKWLQVVDSVPSAYLPAHQTDGYVTRHVRIEGDRA